MVSFDKIVSIFRGGREHASRHNPARRSSRPPMSSSQRKRVAILGICLAVAALLWIVFAPRVGIYSVLHERSRLARLQAENLEIRQKNKTLEKEIKDIQNDPEYLEHVAREKYGLLKENEMIFEFPADKKRRKNDRPASK